MHLFTGSVIVKIVFSVFAATHCSVIRAKIVDSFQNPVYLQFSVQNLYTEFPRSV